MKNLFLILFCVSIARPLQARSYCAQLFERPVEARLQNIISGNNFNTIRPLIYYLADLGRSFIRDLRNLGASDHWIDAGSGDGIALSDYIENGYQEAGKGYETFFEIYRSMRGKPHASVTGITYKISEGRDRHLPDGMRILRDRYFEDIPSHEIGRAKLITDFYGIVAYSGRPDLVLKKYIELLEVGGAAYLFLGHFNELYQNTVKTREGRTISFVQWIKEIPGIKVTIEKSHHEGLKPYAEQDGVKLPPNWHTLRIEKISEDVPELRALRVAEVRPSIVKSPAPIRVMVEVD